MTGKQPSNKEILNDLIDKIKEIKRITQGKISILAGYETENYLAEAKSSNIVSDNIIKRVQSLYEKAKINPSILEEDFETSANEDQADYKQKYLYALEEIRELQKQLLEKKIHDNSKNGSPPLKTPNIKLLK